MEISKSGSYYFVSWCELFILRSSHLAPYAIGSAVQVYQVIPAFGYGAYIYFRSVKVNH